MILAVSLIFCSDDNDVSLNTHETCDFFVLKVQYLEMSHKCLDRMYLFWEYWMQVPLFRLNLSTFYFPVSHLA
jgi:hypothetical protein